MEHRLTDTGGIVRGIVVAIALALLTSTVGCATQDRWPAPSLDDIVRMSEEGEPDDEIIALLIESRAVYPLTSSKIVELHEQGVATDVLDHLQRAKPRTPYPPSEISSNGCPRSLAASLR